MDNVSPLYLAPVWECRLRGAQNCWFEIFDSFEMFQTQKTAFKISHKLPPLLISCRISSIYTQNVQQKNPFNSTS